MKANELMCGDLVMYGDETVVIKGLGVCSVAFSEGNKKATWYYDSSVEPIPLTEEILRANGIPTNGDVFCFDDDEDYKLELSFIRGGLHWTVNCAEYTLMNFHYVHELQHALRLCGLYERADNFKLVNCEQTTERKIDAIPN